MRNERFPFVVPAFKIRNYFFHLLVLLLLQNFSFSEKSALAWGFRSQKKDVPSPVSVIDKEQLDDRPAHDPASIAQALVIADRLPSAQKMIRKVPANVSIKSKEDLKSQRSLTFQEAVKDLEGTVLYDSVGNGIDTTVSLRGFQSSSDIVFLLDGVRINEVDGGTVHFPLITMTDLESIQVDRGSASPIYGSGAFAGVVNLTSRRPSLKPFSLFGGAEWSSFGGVRFHDGISGTLEDRVSPLEGRWSYYFNGARDLLNGFRENGEWRITSFDAKTAYELPEGQGRFEVGVKHIHDSASNPGELTFQQFQDNQEASNKPLDGRNIESTIVHLNGEKKLFDNHLVASILSSWRMNRIGAMTTFGTFTDADGFNSDTNWVTLKSREADLTWQLKHLHAWDDLDHEALLGMEHRSGRTLSVQRDAFGGLVRPTATETDRSASPDNTALFWRESLQFFDRVTPHFGMRHDWHSMETFDQRSPRDNIDKEWSRSTLSAGITAQPVSFADLFLNYSQGFRVPTIDELAPFAGTVSATLEPESTDSYEAGTRLRYKEIAETKFSYFLIDLKDEITFDSTSISATSPFGRNINIGQSRRYGIELRQDIQPLQEIRLYGSYTWTRAYVRETDGAQSLRDGRTLGQIPENRFTAGGELSPLERFGEPFDGFKLSLRGAYTGRQHPTSYESASQASLNAAGGAGHWIKAYSIWDFMMSFRWREKQLYMKVNNLFDEKYYSRAVTATSFGTAIYPAGTYSFVNPGAPREFVLGAEWEF